MEVAVRKIATKMLEVEADQFVVIESVDGEVYMISGVPCDCAERQRDAAALLEAASARQAG